MSLTYTTAGERMPAAAEAAAAEQADAAAVLNPQMSTLYVQADMDLSYI
jgi:hypothetical protein